MFSKGNKEKKSEINPTMENLTPTNYGNTDVEIEESSAPIPDDVMDKEQIQTVKLVEKISAILSPYFIVIVGLYLSDASFFNRLCVGSYRYFVSIKNFFTGCYGLS